mmetsp:Transcript_8045/g.18363  ORF Transcript_8045/g.18363 Transcript_8045/m.18363 type:complete len:537 (+) Transcript_8045:97-1707(+)|eukprot:CAMPEP_0172595258 /NCGR_PEP_ID=MMETSP1068-20121228/14810_1 /TAXON_ID=35684 /ORGANISM="Pseudopedinella elastica, Strain CCMP716" /LENGTH=536 /DNA_ID=CAMNT_0013393697 /DNA_START=75 /DNA_END=1685 /DNA_ORIENTATION=-
MAEKAQKGIVLSAGLVASVGLTTSFVVMMVKRFKRWQRNSETSRLAEAVVNQPFSVGEWAKMSRSRSVDMDPTQINTPQKPVAHPTMGGITGTPDTIALVMVGLPGRGKTAIAARTCRYLRFFHGLECQHFNVGDRRRAGAGYFMHSEYTFDEKAIKQRKVYSDKTLQELKLFLLTPGRIAIFDSSNVTSERRLEVYSEIKKLGKVDVIFVEVMSDETNVSEEEMAEGDVAGAAAIDSIQDYGMRVANYQKVYEPIASGNEDEDDHEHNFSYIKCINGGKQIIMNKIDGYMPGRIAQFITNCCHCHWTSEKRLYLSRHGQSEYNATGRIGGDSDLTEMGERYALALRDLAETRIRTHPRDASLVVPARLWTSTLKRTRNTARHITTPTIMTSTGHPWVQMKPRVWSNLDEIYAGACDGMTYEEIKERFPKEAALRKKDKLSYRYPRGESYLDVIQRLEPLVQEIERHREPLLIVGHQGVLRMIYAFYAGIDREDAPHQELKLNHVTVLTPHAYGCGVEVMNLLEKETPTDDGQKHH